MFADARAKTPNRWATRETMDLTIGLSVEIDPVPHSHPGRHLDVCRRPRARRNAESMGDAA